MPDDVIGRKFNFLPSRPESEIVDEFIYIWDYLYEPSRFLARVYRYFLSMRSTSKAMSKQKDVTVAPVPQADRQPLRPHRPSGFFHTRVALGNPFLLQAAMLEAVHRHGAKPPPPVETVPRILRARSGHVPSATIMLDTKRTG